MATEQEYRSILIPNQPFRRLKIADYISQGKKKKLFKGEYIRTSAKTIDDLYYYYIDEGQIVATFEQESGEVAPLYWRNAGNAFSAEYNDYASIGRYKARFIAAQNTVLFAFTQRQLYELSQDDPELFYEFINVCHMSFAQMGHRISNTGYQSSTKRMIMWLQKLCATQECDEHGVYDIECKLTLQQLSELLSIHITTCTKIVAALENLVGEHARQRVQHERGHGAGQQHHSGFERGSAAQPFHVQRHDQRHAHEGGVQQVLRDEARAILTRYEDIHADQRVVHPLLPPHEQHEEQRAQHKRSPDERAFEREAARVRERQQQPAEPERRLRERHHVEARALVGSRRGFDGDGRRSGKHQHDDHEQHEKAAPSQREAHRPADGGTDVRREAHRNACHAHGRGLTTAREARHGDGLHEGHEHARGDSLEHAARQQHAEVGSK